MVEIDDITDQVNESVEREEEGSVDKNEQQLRMKSQKLAQKEKKYIKYSDVHS